MKSILFVCTGNTCRSPMAEGIAKKIFAQNGLDVKISSAGIMVGHPTKPSENAILTMKEMDIDISNHISQAIDKKMVDAGHLILTMTNGHKEYLCGAFPYASDKVYTLAYFACKDSYDIIDPFGGDLSVYQKCADELYSLINIISKNIVDSRV